MKKGRMAEIVKELQGASKMHLKQSKEIAEHIDDMKSPASRNSEKQSLQTQYRKFKAKAGSKVRKLLGEPEPTIRDPKDYNPPVKPLKQKAKKTSK